MIEAGAAALMFYDRNTWDAQETAKHVFMEMAAASDRHDNCPATPPDEK